MADQAAVIDVAAEDIIHEDVAVESAPVEDIVADPASAEDIQVEDLPVEDVAVDEVAVEDLPVEDVAVEEVSVDASQPLEPQPEPVTAEHEAEPAPEPVAEEPEPVAAYADYAAPDDDTDYADSPLGSPLYDQVAFGHPQRPDYFVAVPYSAEPPEQSPAQSWYADQPWRTDPAHEPLEHHDYAPWDEPAAGGEPGETASEAAAESTWSSYAPSATVLPGEPTTWS